MRVIVPVLLSLALLSCDSPNNGPVSNSYGIPGYPAPSVAAVTTWGLSIRYPVWLTLEVNETRYMSKLLEELRTVRPEPDPRYAPSLGVGVPLEISVVILDPGPYYAKYSPTGLANGESRFDTNTIYVAWRGSPREPVLLPALAHELRHMLTRDPLAGH